MAKEPVGQVALHAQVCADLPEPPVCSYVGAGSRKTVVEQDRTEDFYTLQYKTDGSIIENLRFAFKHEPIDLRIVTRSLQELGAEKIRAWVEAEPTGGYARRAWFLYEKFVGKLNLPDVTSGNYVDALDPKKHIVSEPANSKRHRVRDNLLGNSKLCPVVRRTKRIDSMMAWDLETEVQNVTKLYRQDTIARAVNFLYTKETRSSYAIEGETPSASREERFLSALKQAGRFFPTDMMGITALQNKIVDPRYQASGWREDQNFVSEVTRGYGEHVHFICPKPEDVPKLMDGWLSMSERLRKAPLNPVVAAAVLAFSFVFIHPFEDGNGRIHRFIIHALLASRKFGPSGFILPVSAAILRQRAEYDRVLEIFSGSIMRAIKWDFEEDGSIVVTNETCDLYRFFDATSQVEFLFDRMAEAIRTDLLEEVSFLDTFDGALKAVREVVDMPDKKAALLVKICLNNRGRLSKKKRKEFEEINDAEVAKIEEKILSILKKSQPLASIGWSEQRVLSVLEESGTLTEAIERGLQSLDVEWEDVSDADELDEIYSWDFKGDYDLYDLEIESVERTGEGFVTVTLTGELTFRVDFEVTVCDSSLRVYDPEDRSRVILQPPTASMLLSDMDFERTVSLTLTLYDKDAFKVEVDFDDESPLTVVRPDYEPDGNEWDEEPEPPESYSDEPDDDDTSG